MGVRRGGDHLKLSRNKNTKIAAGYPPKLGN
jgi:hypothetical protein